MDGPAPVTPTLGDAMIGGFPCGRLYECVKNLPPPQQPPSLWSSSPPESPPPLSPASSSPPPQQPHIVNDAAAADAAAHFSAAVAAGEACTAATLVGATSHAIGKPHIHHGGLKSDYATGNALAVCPPAYPPGSYSASTRAFILPSRRRSPRGLPARPVRRKDTRLAAPMGYAIAATATRIRLVCPPTQQG